MNHIYYSTGTVTVSVSLIDSFGTQMTLTQDVNVIAYNESYLCISDLQLSVPNTANVGQPLSASVSLPACMTNSVTDVQWNFGDNGTTVQGTSVQYTYNSPGSYTVTLSVTAGSSVFTVTTSIDVLGSNPTPSPSPSPTPSPSPSPTPTPAPSPAPTPTPTPSPCASPSFNTGDVIVLDPHSNGSLSLTGHAEIDTTGNIYVNSDHSQASRLTGNAQISASSMFVTGGEILTGNSQVNAPLSLGAAPIADPLSQLSAPSESGLNSFGYTKVSGGSVQLSPGVYTSAVSITGQARVTLKPGTYIFENGCQITGGADVSGDGVFIYLKGGSLQVTGNSKIHFTSNDSDSCHKGVTIYQPAENTGNDSFTGASGWSLGGALYAPTATLNMTGATHADSPSASALIVNRLNMTGGSTWIGH
jgi:PKD repeat protein